PCITSGRFTQAAKTRMRPWPEPDCGVGRRVRRRTSGPPGVEISTTLIVAGRSAFISLPILKRVLKSGSAGDSPAPVGDPPTGTALSHTANRQLSLPRSVVLVPSGESPDKTGGSPVLPGPISEHTSLVDHFQMPSATNSSVAFRAQSLLAAGLAGLG